MEEDPMRPSRRTARIVAILTVLALSWSPTMWATSTAQAQVDPTPPVAAPAATAPTGSHRVALVLGGGAARGTAHVGVIRALVDAGVPIDMIVGTSMGSLIGGLYAAGFDADTLAEAVVEIDPSSAAELLLPPRGGILDGQPLAMLLDALVEGRQLDELEIPFHAVVIDLFSGEPQVAPAGSLATAIRASTAIPVLFDPVEIDGRFFYDGALKKTTAAALARELGATYVIAVDVARDLPFDPANVAANLSRIFVGLTESFNVAELAGADVVLDPGLRDNTYMDFDLASDFVVAGEQVTRAELPRILADLSELGIELRPPGDPHLGLPINEGWRERAAAARTEIALRPRPWNLAFDLRFSPSAGGDRVTPAPAPVGSRLRAGVELRDGPLGPGFFGASYARSVTGGTDAVHLWGGYRLDHDLRLFARADLERAGGWDTRWGVRWQAMPDLELEAALRVPRIGFDAGARWRMPGLWLDGALAVGLVDGWARGHLDARAAIASADPRWDALELRGRAFVGSSLGAPTSERFSVGPAIGLRGTPPDASIAPTVAVASVELAARIDAVRSVLGAAVVVPSVWAFADTAVFADTDGARNVFAVGVGAGIAGRLFGFVPFAAGFDVGYGVTAGTWYLGWRWGPTFPVAVRF
jgi:NTE family protein